MLIEIEPSLKKASTPLQIQKRGALKRRQINKKLVFEVSNMLHFVTNKLPQIKISDLILAATGT